MPVEALNEVTIVPPDTSECTEQASKITLAAKSMRVVDAQTYATAGEFLKHIKKARQVLADTFNDPIAKAHETHKAMLAAKKQHDQPLDQAEQLVKSKMLDWQREEDRKRREEEARLREQARKLEEERRLAEAAELERQGESERAEAVIAAPVVAPPVVLAPTTPKVSGISTRKVWKFRIVDQNIIPRNYMIPDEKALGSLARSLQERASVPGVEFYADETMSASGR